MRIQKRQKQRREERTAERKGKRTQSLDVGGAADVVV